MNKAHDSLYQHVSFVHSRIVVYVGVVVLLILAGLSLGRAVQFTFFSPLGGIDFYGFWRAGLFIRQATDPYAAFLAHIAPVTPITFLDGSIYERLPHDDQLSIAPTNTAPTLLLFYLFAWLPWPMAKTIWFLFNCALALSLPLLLVRLYPSTQRWPRVLLFSVCLTFYALKSVRGALGTGQTTVLVVTLMAVCLLIWQKHGIIAGLVLGIALSKYSVALPLLLYALYERRFRVIVASAIVQVGATIGLSLLSQRSPFSILWNYYLIMLQHVGQPGIHLAELFPTGTSARIIAPLILTMGFVMLIGWLRYNYRWETPPPDVCQFHNLHVFTALMLWTLLVAYHRPYDGMLILFFIILVIDGLLNPRYWRLAPSGQVGVMLALVFSIATFILPYEEIGTLLPRLFTDQVLWLVAKTVILTLVGMLVLNLWLLYRVRKQFV